MTPRWVVVAEEAGTRTETLVDTSRVERLMLRMPVLWKRVWSRAT